MHMANLTLIDGSSYLFRAYHALPPLTNADGEPTGALFGVFNMLRETLAARPDHVAFVSDASGPTFRNEMYADYKANRPPMPDDLRSQVEPMLDMVDALGLPVLRISGVEADDVIGTLALQAKGAGMDVMISTSDKDFAQLVGPQISLINTMTGKLMDRDGVIDKFGVPPEQIIDYLALVGDKVDNVPGVNKCGPKTAAKWLAEHGSLDAIMEQADSFGGKIGGYLRDALPQLLLSRQLVTIKTDVELDRKPQDLKQADPDIERLRDIYTRYGFKSALAALEGGTSAASDSNQIDPASDDKPPKKGEYELVTSTQRLDTWLKKLRSADLIAFDTETTSIDPRCRRAETRQHAGILRLERHLGPPQPGQPGARLPEDGDHTLRDGRRQGHQTDSILRGAIGYRWRLRRRRCRHHHATAPGTVAPP